MRSDGHKLVDNLKKKHGSDKTIELIEKQFLSDSKLYESGALAYPAYRVSMDTLEYAKKGMSPDGVFWKDIKKHLKSD